MCAHHRRPCRVLFFVIAPVLGLCRDAWAVPTSTITTIEPVIVRTRRPSPKDSDPSASMVEVDQAKLDRARALGLDTGEALGVVAGARVIDLGGRGREKLASLRGAAPHQTLVLVDGVPVRSPFALGADLSLIDIEDISTIEVLRGGAGATHASGALGGVVSVRRARLYPPESRVSLSYGSFSTLGVSGRTGVEGLAASGSYLRSRGDFPYVSSIPGLPDVDEVRDNNGVERGALSVRAQREAGAFVLGGSLAGVYRNQGVPGLETQEDLDAREGRGQGLVRLTAERAKGRDRLGIRFGAQASLMTIDYQDVVFGTDVDSFTRFVAFGADGSLFGIRKGRHELSLGLDGELESSHSTEREDRSRPRVGGAAKDEIDLDPLTILLAVRGEMISDSDFLALPRAGIRLALGEDLYLRASAARSGRAPTIDELYQPTEAGLSGNPLLVPETAWEAEIGVEWAPRGFSVAAQVFARSIEELILYINRNAFEVRPENVGAARVVGGELSISTVRRVGPLEIDWSADGSTLPLAVLDATDERAPGHPELSLSSELVLTLHRLPLASSLSLNNRVSLSSPVSANLSGTLEAEAYRRWDAALCAELVEDATLSLLVQNVLDERTLETVHKIPLPGRAFLTTLRVVGL